MAWLHTTDVRTAEARRVAARLGVPQKNLTFFRARDGGIPEEMCGLLPEIRKWLDRVNPDRLCSCAFEQGHLDHDAANMLATLGFPGLVLEVPLYHTYLHKYKLTNRFANPAGEHVLDLTPEERRLKLWAARQYPSQPLWRKLIAYEAWNALRLKPARLARTERMRFKVHEDFLVPDVPEPLRSKVEQSAKWQRWLLAAQRLESGEMFRETRTASSSTSLL